MVAGGVTARPWEWQEQEARWLEPADEFQPVARRWVERGWKRAADIGCGLGRHSLFLASLGFEVTAIDLSPRGLERLRAEARRLGLDRSIRALEGDMVDLPEDLGTFDCVVSFHAIYHTDRAGLERAISWVTRHLRPGGGFYVTFNSKSNASFRNPAHRRLDEHTLLKQSGPEAGIPHTYVDYGDVRQLLQGYELAKVQQVEDYYGEGKSGIHFFVEAYRFPG